MNKMNRFFKELISWIMYMAVWMGVLFLVYRYVAQPFKVEGSSMEHTLEDQQRVWMWKLSEIERFDVVIFPKPYGQDAGQELYVKRVIGLPGDTIAYKDEKLVINGQTVDEHYLDAKSQEFHEVTEGDFTEEFELADVTGEQVVPKGKLFVLGDNRRNSVDGRSFGFIDADSVLGKATFIYWPLSDFGSLHHYELNDTGDKILEK